ncbi:hypothetical protein R1flu_013255 [Riccia fluitans]|uniref:Uncharacterized protein n=1 Tax=Riccia fluitans TaxID=41844 RepID=A0ABD1YGC4_9MARC
MHSWRHVESIAALDVPSRCFSFTGSHSEIATHTALSLAAEGISPLALVRMQGKRIVQSVDRTVDMVDRERLSRPASYAVNYGATKGQPCLGLAYARPGISLPPARDATGRNQIVTLRAG